MFLTNEEPEDPDPGSPTNPPETGEDRWPCMAEDEEPRRGAFRDEAPKFDGRKGERYTRWKLLYKEYLLTQRLRGILTTDEDRWEVLPFAFEYSSPVFYQFENKRTELLTNQRMQRQLAAPAAAAADPDYSALLAATWQWLDSSYGVPDAVELQEFLNLRRDTRRAAQQSVAGWGACVLGKFTPLSARNLVTVAQANQVFLDGLEEGIRQDLHPFLLDHPVNTCPVGMLVDRAEQVAQGRASLAAAPGKVPRKPAASEVFAQLSDAAKRKLLKQLAADLNLSDPTAPSQSSSSPPGPKGTKYCSLHRTNRHSDAECREQQRSAGAKTPGALANAAQSPGAPFCDHCRKTGHTQEKCWELHPEYRPAWYRERREPRPHRPATNAHTASKPTPALTELLQAMLGQCSGEYTAPQHPQPPAPQQQIQQLAPALAATPEQGAPNVPDPWATDHAAHSVAAAYSKPAELPVSFKVLPAQPREPNSAHGKSASSSTAPVLTSPAPAVPLPANTVQQLVQAVSQLTQVVQQLTLVSSAHPPTTGADPATPETPVPQAANSLTPGNALGRALWYLGPEQPPSHGLRVLDADGKQLDTANPMVDTGANCIIASEAWCMRNKLTFAEVEQPLNGALGTGHAAGYLLSPLELVLCQNTPHETRVSIGGKLGHQVLVSKGTEHVYDLLLGTAFLHQVGGCVDLYSQEFVFRPFLHTQNNGQTKVAVPLRPHVAAVHANNPVSDGSLSHTHGLIACCAVQAGDNNVQTGNTPLRSCRKLSRKRSAQCGRLRAWLSLILLSTLSMIGKVAGTALHGNTDTDPSWRARSSSTLAALQLHVTPSFLVQTTMPSGHEACLTEQQYTVDPVNHWTWGNHPDTTEAQREQLRSAIAAHRHAFAYSVEDLPGYSGAVGPYRIEMIDEGEIIDPPRRYSKLEREAIDKKCSELLNAGIIQPQLLTRYAACPVVVAKKDADGNWTDARFCVDERRINANTKADRYTMPLPEQIFQDVHDCKFFSKIDLRAGFHQIPIAPEDQEKTTFWWGNKTYSYVRMCFGLRNATAHFCRVMDHEIRRAGLVGNASAFVDDVLIYSRTFDEHLDHVSRMLTALHEVGLRAHPEKSTFCASSVEFLGHVVSSYGLSPHEAKVAAIRALPEPANVSELQSVLGFMNYYRAYVPNYSAIARPLTRLTSKNTPWEWGELQARAFSQLKDELCTEGRALRRAEDGCPYLLYTDWSGDGIGAVLAQKHPDGNEYMTACISRSLNKHESNYSSYEGEMLAAVWAIKTFRPYLHGTPFTVITDHQPLAYLMKTPNLTGKHARWALSLLDYEFSVVHRPGKTHTNADVPSRFPRGTAFDGTGARLDGDPFDPAAKAPSVLGKTSCFALAPPPSPSGPQYAPADSSPAVPPCVDGVLHGNLHSWESSSPPDLGLAAEFAEALRRTAMTCARRATPPLERHVSFAGTAASDRIDTTPVTPAYYAAAAAHGLTVVELCGGIGAGLEAVLRNGFSVSRYIYSDIDERARTAIRHRVTALALQYPDQLSHDLSNSMFCLPQDVAQISHSHLTGCVPSHPDAPLLVVAGWPCQDLSPAGSGKGLQGARSSLYYKVEHTVIQLQQLHNPACVAYLLENAAMQHSFNHIAQARAAYDELVQRLGEPICVDAARFNSRAHRLRNYWTNLAPAKHLQVAADSWQRTPGLYVDDILIPGRTAQLLGWL